MEACVRFLGWALDYLPFSSTKMGNIGSLEKAELKRRSCEAHLANRSCRSPREKLESMFAAKNESKGLSRPKESTNSKNISDPAGALTLELPSPVFEPNGTDIIGHESDAIEEDERKESPPEKTGMVSSLFNFLGKPFSESDPSLVVVNGRMWQPVGVSSGEIYDGTSHCDVHQLRASQGFTLVAMRNISAAEAKELKKGSIIDPATLVGFQICLLPEEQSDAPEGKYDNGDDYLDDDPESVQSLRIRVVCAYSKEATDSFFRRSKYRLMSPSGELHWVELRRGPSKRGVNFTPLRRVC